MKKGLFALTLITVFAFGAFSQRNLSVDIDDEVYTLLDMLQNRDLIPFSIGTKPYTRSFIYNTLCEALKNGTAPKLESLSRYDGEGNYIALPYNQFKGNLTPNEVAILKTQIKRFRPKGADLPPPKDEELTCENDQILFAPRHVGWVYTHLQNNSTKIPLSFEYNFVAEANLSGGVYTKSDFNAFAFDFIANYDFSGDISKFFSYRLHGVLDISRVPLYERGDDYFVGYSWFDENLLSPDGTTNAGKNYSVSNFIDGISEDGLDRARQKYGEPRRRILRKQSNTAYLPFTYKRKFGGQVYYLENLSASGLEGWPTTTAITFAITADLRTSLLGDRVNIGFGRIRREWAAMDKGSSLILSDKALPFMAFDMAFDILPCLKFSSLVGILEYPNQDYIADLSWPDDKEDDSLFQNAFSINMLELDWKYFHFDFGSSVVWPKRFELGYIFPLMNYVVYQNFLGDNDNCALFADIKFRKPNIGELWASLYLDEINGLNNNPFTSARAMFAGQLGVKVTIPKLPFTHLSFRYTKVEPFCYTHHSINYTPWYNHYISESYQSGGDPLGYYLPPNADEFLLRFESAPIDGVMCNLTYQFIRHGADYGSQQVQGSSAYSELTNQDRDEVLKTFLHDGAYNWMHILSLGATYSNRKTKVPFSVSANVGFMYSYYTMISDSDYEMTVLGNHKCSKYTNYHWVDTNEYPVQCGAVISLGVKLWQF